MPSPSPRDGGSRPRLHAIARGLVVAVILLVGALGNGDARAEVPVLKKGINFEIWQRWTSRDGFFAPGFDRTDFPDWQKAVDDRRLALLRAQGFDFVRLNVDVQPFFWDEAGGDALLDAVERSVKRLLAADFKVVIDMHTIGDQPDRPQGMRWILGAGEFKRAEGFVPYLGIVRLFATRFRDYPADRVVLEPMNEPDQDWWSRLVALDRWPGQLATLHKTARRAAPKLPLMLAGNRSGGPEGLLRLDPSPFAGDDAVMWTFHYYQPMAITHSGQPWEESASRFLTGLPFPADRLDATSTKALVAAAVARMKTIVAEPERRAKLEREIGEAMAKYAASGASPATIAAEIAEIGAWAKKFGIRPERIVLGEFGVFQDAVAPEIRAEIIRATRVAAEAEGFGWAAYTAGLTRARHSFGILDDTTTMRVDDRVARALGLR